MRVRPWQVRHAVQGIVDQVLTNMAVLLHDVGKSRVDVDIIMKEGMLTPEEFSRMQAHTWLGALSVFGLREFGEIPLRGMITAYEHHMKVDLSGYPKGRRPALNLLGIYPVGACVILDTFDVGLVHAANSDAAHIHRPVVRVLCNADGSWIDDPPLADLADTESDGSFSRSIIKVTDPGKYLINVSDYFV